MAEEFNFIKDIERSTIDAFNKEHPYEQSFYNDAAGFIAAVDWNNDKNWLLIVLGLHIVLLSLVLCFRRYELVQFGVFCTICGTVYLSETINYYLHDHWREFATQDYFDRHGVFLSVILGAPLLLIGFTQVCTQRPAH